MKRSSLQLLAPVFMAMGALLAPALGTDLPDLPSWSPSDFEKLKSGDLVPGEDFFGDPAENGEGLAEGILPELPEGEARPEEYVREISPLHLKRYFSAIARDPKGQTSFLVDPQELLAQQEYRDRQSFLAYHSDESAIDMFVYLFDGRQELPDDVTIESVFENLYGAYGSSAVVFYYLGMPERAELMLSEDLRAVVSRDEQSRALRAAVQEAFEKSDAAYQLDNFLVELSIRLYWIEREVAGKGTSAETVADRSATASRPAVLSAATQDPTRRLVARALLWAAIMGAATLLGWLGHLWLERRARYVFPEVDTGPLLGAPHAAGVGAVVSFSSAQLPPAQQRDQVPDYLQRM